MSHDLLTLLRDFGAFDPAPRHAELSEMHVPYDQLTDSPTCEAALLEAVRSEDRVALIGVSGAGKSSIIAGTLGPLVEGIFPLQVPVYAESADTVANPVTFVAHLVRTVARMLSNQRGDLARSAGRIEKRALPPGETPTKHRVRAGFRTGPIGPELAYELERATNSVAPTAAQVMDQGREILDLIAGDQLIPILLLDDTDRWTVAVSPEMVKLRRSFFRTVPRLLAEELGVAAVLSIHPEYTDDAEFGAAQGFITRAILVPPVPHARATGQILARRIELARGLATEDTSEVFTADAIDLLYSHYAAWPSNIRRNILLPAHTALSLALDDDADLIDEGHVLVAISG